MVPSPSSHLLNSPYGVRSNLIPYLVNAHDGSPEPGAQAVQLCPKGLQVSSPPSRLGGAELAAEQRGHGVDEHEARHAPGQQQGQLRQALLEGVLPHTHTGTVTQGKEPCWDIRRLNYSNHHCSTSSGISESWRQLVDLWASPVTTSGGFTEEKMEETKLQPAFTCSSDFTEPFKSQGCSSTLLNCSVFMELFNVKGLEWT